MKRLALLTLAATTLAAAPLRAQQAPAPTGLRASVLPDIDNLTSKFTALAGAMTGKYDWRPGEGVRSVAEVFNLIAGENRMIVGVVTGAPMQGPRPAPITDPTQMQEALRSSYATLKQSIAALPEADLNTNVKLFGREMTKAAAIYVMLADQHEHLGQSIAYARTNGVVPPWSVKAK